MGFIEVRGIREPCDRFRDAFREIRILRGFIGIVDNVNSTLIIAERYGRGLPPVSVRTFIYDGISRLDDLLGSAVDILER
jgi:hypothetical protein